MVLAGIFGLFLLLVLILGDWYQFTNLRSPSACYGCGVARREEPLEKSFTSSLHGHFNQQGLLSLPHGIAKLFHQQQIIVFRPYYKLFAIRFRTAWPLKGTLELVENEQGFHLKLVKKMPWSSVVITLTWLGIVILGTLGFVLTFGMDGGFVSAGGLLLGLGVVGLGILVLLFGLIMISLAYRLEDQRLMQVYQELREILMPHQVPLQEQSKGISNSP